MNPPRLSRITIILCGAAVVSALAVAVDAAAGAAVRADGSNVASESRDKNVSAHPRAATQEQQHTVVFELAADPGSGPVKIALHWDGMLAANALVTATLPRTTQVKTLLPKGVEALALRYVPDRAGRKLYIVAASIDGQPIAVSSLKYFADGSAKLISSARGIAAGQVVISRADVAPAVVSTADARP